MDRESTFRAAASAARLLRPAIKRCRGNVACVFKAYGGVRSVDDPRIKARVQTFQRIRLQTSEPAAQQRSGSWSQPMKEVMTMPILKTCETCGKEFGVKPYRSEVARFCSRVCAGELPWLDRFRARVDDSRGPEACWPWVNPPKGRGGYGRIWINGQQVGTHRVAWALGNGVDPLFVGGHVCHHCDFPACCNPAHLYLGDLATNMADKVAKSRHAFGERRPEAKLTEQQVLALRRLKRIGGNIAKAARRLGVSTAVARRAAVGISWKHLPMPGENR